MTEILKEVIDNFNAITNYADIQNEWHGIEIKSGNHIKRILFPFGAEYVVTLNKVHPQDDITAFYQSNADITSVIIKGVLRLQFRFQDSVIFLAPSSVYSIKGGEELRALSSGNEEPVYTLAIFKTDFDLMYNKDCVPLSDEEFREIYSVFEQALVKK